MSPSTAAVPTLPALGTRYPKWTQTVSFRLQFARAALHLQFPVPSTSSSTSTSTSTTSFTPITHSCAHPNCPFTYTLHWDSTTAEYVIVSIIPSSSQSSSTSTIHNHPLALSQPQVEHLKTVIHSLEKEQDKLWTALCAQALVREREKANKKKIKSSSSSSNSKRRDSSGGDSNKTPVPSTTPSHTQQSTPTTVKRPRGTGSAANASSPPPKSSASKSQATSPVSALGISGSDVPSLPQPGQTYPSSETFRASITAYAQHVGFKAWIAGGAHGAPRCRMICSRSRKNYPGEAKCGFSVSVRKGDEKNGEWVVEEVVGGHTHKLGLAVPSSAGGSGRRDATPASSIVEDLEEDEGEEEEGTVAAKEEEQDEDGGEEEEEEEEEDEISWTERPFSQRDTEKIRRLVKKSPHLPPESMTPESSYGNLSVRIGASAERHGFSVMPLIASVNDRRRLVCNSSKKCPWYVEVRRTGRDEWKRVGKLPQAHTGHKLEPTGTEGLIEEVLKDEKEGSAGEEEQEEEKEEEEGPRRKKTRRAQSEVNSEVG
ncbi:hypothetical protein T439DRAFT_322115 [Meredithblackwellia eburnea MCA 4105]